MSTINTANTTLPWSAASADEGRFHRIVIITLLLALLFGVIMIVVDAPKIERATAEKVPPRLAKMLLEKTKVEPPKIEPVKPEPEPEKPKVEEEKKPEPVPEKPKPIEPKPEPKPEPKQPLEVENIVAPKPAVDIAAARKKAASSGVLAMKDMLADLREAEPAEAIQQQSTQQLQSGGSEASAPSRSILTSKASKGSGGIDTSKFSRDTGGKTALAGHDTATVVSRLDTLPAAQAQKREEQAAKQTSGRSEAEIQRTMEANKGALYSIYQRALRQNPAMQGKVVFKIVIAASGEVTECDVLSSELGDPDLERKLALRIKRIDFGAKNVETTSITYPIDFLPNL